MGKILAYEMDSPTDEFGFSLRLAQDNNWPIQFTQQAILEYKKFMYLAAISRQMVSPSPIIDEVWHLHIIYTQSYSNFCEILGKFIQHIPSTGNKSEKEDFSLAKQYTKDLYDKNFGNYPELIWIYNSFYESLNLTRANTKLETKLFYVLLGFIVSFLSLAYLLKPLYITINNPIFVVFLFIIFGISLLVLILYNSKTAGKIFNNQQVDFPIKHLHPSELMFLKSRSNFDYINSILNNLLKTKKIVINENRALFAKFKEENMEFEEQQILNIFKEQNPLSYKQVISKSYLIPYINNISRFSTYLKKIIISSKNYHTLYIINFFVLSLIVFLGLIRIFIGLSRDLPVVIITMALLVLIVISYFFLLNFRRTIPFLSLSKFYKQNNINNSISTATNNHWNYYFLGSSVLATELSTLKKKYFGINNSTGDSTVTTCGSDGGNSCGSSCGGCGGD